MDPVRLKGKFGRRLVLWGGVCDDPREILSRVSVRKRSRAPRAFAGGGISPGSLFPRFRATAARCRESLRPRPPVAGHDAA
jgi:hypothetical protein